MLLLILLKTQEEPLSVSSLLLANNLLVVHSSGLFKSLCIHFFNPFPLGVSLSTTRTNCASNTVRSSPSHLISLILVHSCSKNWVLPLYLPTYSDTRRKPQTFCFFQRPLTNYSLSNVQQEHILNDMRKSE